MWIGNILYLLIDKLIIFRVYSREYGKIHESLSVIQNIRDNRYNRRISNILLISKYFVRGRE